MIFGDKRIDLTPSDYQSAPTYS
jgi:hypothetical protein